MLKTSMLSLPMVLFGASCVPPTFGVETSAGAAPLHRAAPAGQALPSGTSIDQMFAPPPPEREIMEVGPAAKPFDITHRDQEGAGRSLDCLAQAIYYEARSETEAGQLAVAQVVLNRVRHPAFPNSICGVVYQGSARSTGCQFSFTCDGSTNRGAEPTAWARARKIAHAALSGSVSAQVGLATHYHTTAIQPWWAPSLRRVVTVGSHIFYRWRGTGGEPLAFRQSHALVERTASDQPIAVPVTRAVRRSEGEAVAVVVHRGGEASSSEASRAAAALIKVHRASGVEVVSVRVSVNAAATPEQGLATPSSTTE